MTQIAAPNALKASSTALELLREFAIVEPHDIRVEDLATAKGAVVVEGPLEGCEARLVRVGKRGVIRIRTTIKEPGRKRFAAAHEFGHFLMHENVSQYFICTAEDLRDYRKSSVEVEANRFASHLLMPSFLFRPRCRKFDPNIVSAQSLAAEFNTSLTATAIRIVDESAQLCAVVMSRDRVVDWAKFPDEHRWPRIDKGQALSPESLAYHCTTGDQLSPWQEVPTTAWLGDPDAAERWEVMEQSLRFHDYPYVLTLLCLTEKDEPEPDSYDRFSSRRSSPSIVD
jgi:Zn-dependent peptidase ImmA (M78 family)